LVVARPCGYDEEPTKQLWDVIAQRTEAAGLPVLANVDIGYTDPMLTLPIGAARSSTLAGRSFYEATT
jgi:muramoyltetrapeptide carboxypeptidase LdcA involved in peptidoglycan recycling